MCFLQGFFGGVCLFFMLTRHTSSRSHLQGHTYVNLTDLNVSRSAAASVTNGGSLSQSKEDTLSSQMAGLSKFFTATRFVCLFIYLFIGVCLKSLWVAVIFCWMTNQHELIYRILPFFTFDAVAVQQSLIYHRVNLAFYKCYQNYHLLFVYLAKCFCCPFKQTQGKVMMFWMHFYRKGIAQLKEEGTENNTQSNFLFLFFKNFFFLAGFEYITSLICS